MYPVTVDLLKNASRDKILDIIHTELANPGEYTFFFVGNVDVEALKPLVEPAQEPKNISANASDRTKVPHEEKAETS